MSTVTTAVIIPAGPRKGQTITDPRTVEVYTGACLKPGHPNPCTRQQHEQCRRFYDTVPVPGQKASPAAGPSLIQKAGNLVRDTASHLADGMRKVPLEVYNERLAQCQGCPLYRDNHCTHQKCGCTMASASGMMGALWWASKQCPLEAPRWLRYDPSNQSAVQPPAETPGEK